MIKELEVLDNFQIKIFATKHRFLRKCDKECKKTIQI